MLNSKHARPWSEFYASTGSGAALDERIMVLIGLAASIAVDCEPCTEAYLAECRKHSVSDIEIADVLAKVMAVSAGKRKIKLSRILEKTKGHQ